MTKFLTWAWGVKQCEKQICGKSFVKKVSDAFIDKVGFISIKLKIYLKLKMNILNGQIKIEYGWVEKN